MVRGNENHVDFDRLYFIASLVIASRDDQGGRKENLAQLLKGFLNQYRPDHKQGFEDGAKYEAKLLSAAFGVKMLHNIGNIYASSMSCPGDTTNKSEKQAPDGGKENADVIDQKNANENPKNLTEGDIERTFSEVCQTVKQDRKYVEALEMLGKIFLSTEGAGECSSKSTDSGDLVSSDEFGSTGKTIGTNHEKHQKKLGNATRRTLRL